MARLQCPHLCALKIHNVQFHKMSYIKCFLAAIALFAAGAGHAQVSVSVSFPAPPMWGPAGFNEVQYYYLPDVEAFYDVRSSMFIYYGNGAWIRKPSLPSRYRDYDLYGGYKVVMHDYHGKNPYVHYKEYKSKYGKGYRGHPQETIGHRPGPGNHEGQKNQGNGHDKHEGGHEQEQHGNHGGNGNSQGKGHK
jgi:hypothetical protein